MSMWKQTAVLSRRLVSLLSCHSALPLCLCCSLQVKLMKYICKQLQCKQKVPETERPEALDSYPHLRDWLRTINLRPELIQVGHLSLLHDKRSSRPHC